MSDQELLKSVQDIATYLAPVSWWWEPTFWVAAAAAIATVSAAVAAWRAVAATHKAVDAQLAKSFLDEYASRKMSHAIRVLRDHADKHAHGKFEARFDAAVDYEFKEGDEIDSARRMVYWFFRNAWHLYSAGLMSKSAMGVVTTSNAYDIFYNVAYPLSAQLDHNYDHAEWFAWVKQMRQQFPPPDRLWNLDREQQEVAKLGSPDNED